MENGIRLYHFCSNTVFESIIVNRCVWLSDTAMMEDDREISFFWNKIEKVGIKTIPNQYAVKSLAQIKESFCSEKYYVFCLCAEGDSEYMWSKYANDSTGIRIGFDIETINSWCNRIGWNSEVYTHPNRTKAVMFKQVKYYNDDELENYLGGMIREMNSVVDITTNYSKNAPFCKRKKYEQEREYRVVLTPNLSVENAKIAVFDGDGFFIKQLEKQVCKDKEFYPIPIQPEIISSIAIGKNNSLKIEDVYGLLGKSGFLNRNISVVKM